VLKGHELVYPTHFISSIFFFITGSLSSFDRLAVPDYQSSPRAGSTVKCKFKKKKLKKNDDDDDDGF